MTRFEAVERSATSAALRTVFSEPGETLILLLADAESANRLPELVTGFLALKERTTSTRVVVFGNASSQLSKASHSDKVMVLEEWALPVVRETIALASVVVVLGDGYEHLIHEQPESNSPVVWGQPPRRLVSRTGPLHIWDRRSVESLTLMLGDVLTKGGVSAQARSDQSSERPEAGPARNPGRFILQNNWGIGDELLLSAVAREILRAHPELEIWIRSRFGFRFPKYVRRDPPPQDAVAIETIYQNPVLYGPAAHCPFPGHLVQQMLSKFALDTTLAARASDVRPELDLNDMREFRREPRTVIVHTLPNPRLPSKDWGLERWSIVGKILKESGVRLWQVGRKDEPLLADAEDLRAVPVSNLPSVFLRASGVLCVVGFLMHLAEATRTPATVIYGGREHPAIDGYPDQIHLASAPLSCRGRWGCHLAPDMQCSHGMKCMEHLSPELVAAQVLNMLEETGP